MNNRTSGSESQDVIVVGGGIGGLATAFSLRQQGLSVRLLERAPEFGEVGAGLQLGPNATRILDNWGLLDEVRAAGVEPKRLVLGDAITGEKLTHLPLGEEFQQHYGAPYVVVHRSDLHRILLEACREAGVELQTNSTVERVETGSDSARTYLSDGTALKSQVVIGADGLNSRLRSHVVDDEPVCSGYVAYRGAVPISERPDVDLDEVIAWMGPGATSCTTDSGRGRWPTWSPCSAARSTSPAKPTGAARTSSTPRSPSAATAFAKAWTRCGGTGIGRCTTGFRSATGPTVD